MHEPLAARGHTGRRARVGLAGSRLAVWVALLAGGLLLVMVAVGQSAALAWTVAEDASVSAGGPQGPAELGEGEPPEPAPEGEPGPDDPVAEAKGLAADMGSDTASPATPMTVGGTPPPAPTGEQPGPSLMAAQFDHAVLPRAPTPAGGSQPAQSGDDGEPDPDALDRALRAGSGPQAAAPDALERLGFGPAGGDGAPDEQAASAPGVVPQALGSVASMPPVGPATAPDRLDVDWLELVASGQVSPAAAHELDWLRYSTYALSEVNLAAREDLARYMDQDVLGFPSPSALAWRAGDPGGQVAAARWLDGALHDPEQALDEVMHVYDQATRTEFAAEEWAAADDFLGWVEFGNEAVYPHAVLQRWYEFAAGADRAGAAASEWLTSSAQDPGGSVDAWVDALWARHERVWDTAHFPDLSLPFDPNTMTWEPHDPRADTAMTWAANVLSANAHDLGLAAIGSKFEDDLDNERYWRAGTRAVMRALGWTVTRLLPRLGPAAEGTALPPGTEVLGEPPPSPWEAFGDPTNSFGDPVTTVAGAFPPAPSNVVRWAQDYDAETERLRPPDGADDDAVKQWMLNDSRREPVWGLSARIPPVAVHGPFAEGTSAAGMVLDAYDVALDPNVEQLLAIPFEGDEEMYLGVLEGYLKENHVAAYPSESMTVEDLVAITKDDYPAIAVVSRPGGEVGYVTVDGVVTTKGLDGELVTLITFRDPATGKRVLESVDKFAAHFLGRGLATRGYHP